MCHICPFVPESAQHKAALISCLPLPQPPPPLPPPLLLLLPPPPLLPDRQAPQKPSKCTCVVSSSCLLNLTPDAQACSMYRSYGSVPRRIDEEGNAAWVIATACMLSDRNCIAFHTHPFLMYLSPLLSGAPVPVSPAAPSEQSQRFAGGVDRRLMAAISVLFIVIIASFVALNGQVGSAGVAGAAATLRRMADV